MVYSDLENEEGITNILADGYTIRIDISLKQHPDGSEGPSQYHVIEVRDGERVIGRAEGWSFFDTWLEVYMDTPKKNA